MSKTTAKLDVLEAADPPINPSITQLTPINRITQLSDGTLVLHDIVVTSELPDSQGESVDYDSFKAASHEYMKWATVGEMHDPDRWDAGTVLKIFFDDVHRRATADIHVVDPTAVKKVLAKVYKAVSIHGEWLTRKLIKMDGRNVWRIVLKFIDEISLVPRGANPEATFAKRFVLAKIDVAKAEMSGAEVNDLPDSDFAYIEPGGSKDEGGKTVPRSLRHFPIHDEAHVRNALSRLAQSPFESKARPAVEAAARRMKIGEPAEEARKEADVSKAAVAAPAASPLLEGSYVPSASVTSVSPTGEVLEVDGKPVTPGTASNGSATTTVTVAKADPPAAATSTLPAKTKVSKADRKAAKVAKASSPLAVAKAAARAARELERVHKAVAKAKAPTVVKAKDGKKGKLKVDDAHAAIDSAQAMHDAHVDGHDEGMANAHAAIDAAANGDDDGDEVAKTLALQLIRERRVSKARVAKARKVAKSARRRVAKLRRGSGVSKVFRVLAKAGARHSASDLETIRGIHKATVELGYDGCVSKSDDGPVHDVATPAPATMAADPAPAVVAKADATPPPNAFDFEAALREAIPQIGAEATTQIKAALGAQFEELGKRVAKIESRGATGGPATAALGYFDPASGQWIPAEGRSGPVSKADALAAAAAVTEDPALRQRLGQEAGLAELKQTKPWQRVG